jgi:hypothetical protein
MILLCLWATLKFGNVEMWKFENELSRTGSKGMQAPQGRHDKTELYKLITNTSKPLNL